jgi:uncharacterized membrane protein YidH (DUF202 family)
VATSVIGLCMAGVAVVSFEGLDVSESWDIVSPVRHPLSIRRHSRIAAEKGALQLVGVLFVLLHFACWEWLRLFRNLTAQFYTML